MSKLEQTFSWTFSAMLWIRTNWGLAGNVCSQNYSFARSVVLKANNVMTSTRQPPVPTLTENPGGLYREMMNNF